MTDGPDHPWAQAGDDAPAGRFETCRWRTAPGGDDAPYCSHRDVLPYAGTSGFSPQAWCPDCAHFKPRRASRSGQRHALEDF